tara:strand:- start:496 stop:1056 length:561 start_codon:yes stop_codon:yes gene_type:complete
VRAIFILSISVILILSGCATVEVAKEVTKVTRSIKKSIDNIISNEEELNEEELEEQTSSEEKLLKEQTFNEEKLLEEKISMEKQEIAIEKKKEEILIIKQNKIATISFIGKTFEELSQQLGDPKLLREDGKSATARYDTESCRIFIFFNTSIKKPRAEYYELRTTKGKLVERQKDIEKCFSEINLV